MTHGHYLIRQKKNMWEATTKEDGWNCDWEWIYSYDTLEGLIVRLDTDMNREG